MKLRVREIDSRNSLYRLMKYQIICGIPDFFEARNWCWSEFGPGVEYEHYLNLLRTIKDNYVNMDIPRWAWDSAKYQGAAIRNCKLYIKDDADLMLFMLRWG